MKLSVGKGLLGEVVVSLNHYRRACNFSTSWGGVFSPESRISFGILFFLWCGSTCISSSVFWATSVLFFPDKSMSALLEATVFAIPLHIDQLLAPLQGSSFSHLWLLLSLEYSWAVLRSGSASHPSSCLTSSAVTWCHCRPALSRLVQEKQHPKGPDKLSVFFSSFPFAAFCSISNFMVLSERRHFS